MIYRKPLKLQRNVESSPHVPLNAQSTGFQSPLWEEEGVLAGAGALIVIPGIALLFWQEGASQAYLPNALPHGGCREPRGSFHGAPQASYLVKIAIASHFRFSLLPSRSW